VAKQTPADLPQNLTGLRLAANHEDPGASVQIGGHRQGLHAAGMHHLTRRIQTRIARPVHRVVESAIVPHRIALHPDIQPTWIVYGVHRHHAKMLVVGGISAAVSILIEYKTISNLQGKWL
jgi:hypothetical protein